MSSNCTGSTRRNFAILGCSATCSVWVSSKPEVVGGIRAFADQPSPDIKHLKVYYLTRPSSARFAYDRGDALLTFVI